ncbi:MAG TPA: TetR family transcriptional regulator [Bradyrhizobium sp.]|nr:TetR family transcriptional regulator [Bradyrhizobium sp.]
MPQRDADATRSRILEAAKKHFSQNSYEGVGVREIAADAAVDPALISRYFGSKEGLFREIAGQAFGAGKFLADGIEELPARVIRILTGEVDLGDWRGGYDPLRFLLSSIGSPTAGPILAKYLERDFLAPLSSSLGGRNRRERAAILAGQIIGFAVMRIVLSISGSDPAEKAASRRVLAEALATCIAPDREPNGKSRSRKPAG